MRYALAFSALAALAVAAPHPQPQDIDFTDVLAAGSPDLVTPPVDVPSVTVDTQSPAEVSAIGAAAVTDSSVSSRDLKDVLEVVKRDGNCAQQPAGTGPAVSSPADDTTSFLNYQPFHDAANNAITPYGWTLAFQDAQASSQTVNFKGLKTLDKYNPALCSSYCDSIPGCQAFNIYFERDPTLDPGAACSNPTSLTNIKCVAWAAPVNTQTATNKGQSRSSFQVVIAGSNGYNKKPDPPAIAGFNGPVELGGAINAPVDPITKKNTFIGPKFFPFGDANSQLSSFDPSVCTAACSTQTQYDLDHPGNSATPDVCNQVVAYVLSQDGVPQGIYCAMYTEVWGTKYGTNVGQYSGNSYFSVSSAYYYSNATYTYPAICSGGGCPSNSYKGGNCGGWGAGTC